jgi:hypothetical protein
LFILTSTKARQREAYSLVEILAAALVGSILLMGIAACMYLPIRVMKQAEDRDAARRRAEMVFAILKQPLEHCGYGLPKDAAAYKDAFRVQAPPFEWPGPLSVRPFKLQFGLRENAICRIAYAARTYERTICQTTISSGMAKITASNAPPFLKKDTNDNHKELYIDNWILSGAMMPHCLPLMQYYKPERLPDGNTALSFKINRPPGSGEFTIPENDELFYLRAMECSVRMIDGDFIMYTDNFADTGRQPRVEGVIDLRFDLEESGGFMRVWVLTRGDNRYADIVTRGLPPGWPEKYAGGIPYEMRHYMLFASDATFALKNLY